MKYAIVAIAAMAAFFVGGSLPLVWFAANLNSARLAVEARSPLQLEEIEPANLQAVRRPSRIPQTPQVCSTVDANWLPPAISQRRSQAALPASRGN